MTLLLAAFLVLTLLGAAWAVGDGGNAIAIAVTVFGVLGFAFALVNFRRYRVAKPLRPEEGELLASSSE